MTEHGPRNRPLDKDIWLQMIILVPLIALYDCVTKGWGDGVFLLAMGSVIICLWWLIRHRQWSKN